MTNLFSFDSDPASTSNLQALMTWARGVDERMYAYNENLLNLIASMDALAFLLIDAEVVKKEEYATLRALKVAEMKALFKPKGDSDLLVPRTGVISPS